MDDNATATATSKSLSVLNFIFGVWLIISPYILNYATTQARWEQTVAGIIIAIVAAVRYFVPQVTWISWINVAAAVWMIIAPFATGYTSTAAYWNEVIFGILVGLVALWNLGLGSAGMVHRAHMSR